MQPVDVQQLGEGLLREPIKRVNNLTKLLRILAESPAQECRQSALQYLKIFFLASFERGSLTDKPAQVSVAGSQTPQEKLDIWLRQKYEAFCKSLLELLHLDVTSSLQVVMELVRGQQVGVFNHALFNRACTVLWQQPAASQDATQLLTSKFVQYADVRFYTLQTMANVAESAQSQHAASVGGTKGGDSGRRMFELLSAIAPTLAPEGDESVQSWCGATEAGVVGVAPARGEGSQRRRKRKREAIPGEEAPLLGAVQWANPAAYKRAFSEAWLGLLRLPLPSDLLKKVLVQLHSTVMPNLSNPLLLSDFLTSCLNEGGMVGMLALNGIFTLVTRHGLEYPHFYARLYALLQAPVFRAKYRARFLQLADIFLSSGMVPAYTAAAFIKKFARLALTAPPAGAVIAVAFIHNLLRRHPSCSVLVNRPVIPQSMSAATPAAPSQPSTAQAAADKATNNAAVGQNGLPDASMNGHLHSSTDAASSDAEAADNESADNGSQVLNGSSVVASASPAISVAAGAGEDVFDEGEVDPAKCQAIESSLWELESLRHHYHHTVANFVSILDKDLGDRKKTAEVDVGALLRSSYSEYFAAETDRRLKSVPVAFYSEPPTQLFPTAAKLEFPGWVC